MESQLEAELERKATRDARIGRRDYFISESLFWIAVLSSVIATVGATTEWLPKGSTTIAAVTAGALLIETIFRFQERAEWRWENEVAYYNFLRQLRDQKKTVAEISPKVTAFEEEASKRYPRTRWPRLRPSKNGQADK